MKNKRNYPNPVSVFKVAMYMKSIFCNSYFIFYIIIQNNKIWKHTIEKYTYNTHENVHTRGKTKGERPIRYK